MQDVCYPGWYFREMRSSTYASKVGPFITFQVLDLLTTLAGFQLGAAEASPFVRALMHLGPANGVLLAKVLAVGLAWVCLATGRVRILTTANYWYAGLCGWNIGVIAALCLR